MKNNEVIKYIDTMKDAVNELYDHTKTIKKISTIINMSNRVVLCGNGGSSSTASHFVNDLVKMCGKNGICLTDNTPLVTAISNDIDYNDIFTKQVEYIKINKDDCVILLTTSGDSMNILHLASYTKENDIPTIAFINHDGGMLYRLYKNNKNFTMIHIDTDTQHGEDVQLILCHILTLLNINSKK